MTTTTVQIGSFSVNDAELSNAPGQSSQNLISIPCGSDPDLCKQLDGWDDNTSVPAFLDGKEHLLFKQHYDKSADAWILRLE